MEERIYDDRKQTIKNMFNDAKIKPMRFKELAGFLNVPKDERDELNKILDELILEGVIVRDKSGMYGLSKARVFEGNFMTTGKGFGFVGVEGMEDDIYIPESETNGAMQGDRVSVVITSDDTVKNGKKFRREGKIITIIERSVKTLVGYVKRNKNFCFVIPDNTKFDFDVYVPLSEAKGAVTGMKVVCEIIDYGSAKNNPEGKIIEIIGNANDPGVDILSVVKSMGIPYVFPDEVMSQVEHDIPDEISPEDYKGRHDIRDLKTVTIDGEDAKDLDDAITLSKEDNIYHLGVHIADVTNYVIENSPLDKEAKDRGTSVYLTDRVIPMLPHKLSNGICSLNQETDRLALSCFMDIDEEGRIISHKIEETVINVDKRMTYTAVNAIINRTDDKYMEEYSDFIDFFDLMYELSKVLRARRIERGSIDFDLPECKIILNDKGKVVDIKPYERNEATMLIEDFMLAANETVAEEFFWLEAPFVYRNHEEPDTEKLESLRVFIKNFGYKLHIGNEFHGKEIQKLLSELSGTPWEALISRVTLRSMKQARYSTECLGHFGLASRHYCHFTSPIRRYPDLQIHRIIKEHLHGTLDSKRTAHYNEILPDVAASCSMTERRADEAERETDKMKKVEYMKRYMGEVFEGVISSITNWGMYVELPNTVEGLIRFSDIDGDCFAIDKTGYTATGKRSGKTYMLGQKIKVVVFNCDKVMRTIDFVPYFDKENQEG
ncbi:MAG: ribonuclease R [Lachnospiraceae bacterium]